MLAHGWGARRAIQLDCKLPAATSPLRCFIAGAREEDFFFMTVAAEKTNGRAAMLGFATLLALEVHSGFCFF